MTTGEVAGKLSQALSDALVAAHHATIDNHHTKADAARIDFMERMEVELAEVFRGWGLIDFADPALGEAVHKVWASIKEPTHASDFVFTLFATVGAAFSGAFAAAAGINQKLTNQGLARDGYLVPPPDVIAGMQIREFITDDKANELYPATGTKDPIAQAYVNSAFQQLPPGTIIELLRRRLIDEPYARSLLKLNGIPPASIERLLDLRVGPPDLGTAVAAVTQSQIDMVEFADWLEWNGIDRSYATIIFKTAGQSPPPELAGRLFREGWVNEALYKKMLLESPLKNEYVDVLANLRFRFPPMRTVLKMFSDGLILEPKAIEYLEKLGFFPDDAKNLVASAAKHQSTSVKNLSPSTVEKLYARGKYDRAAAMAALEALGYDATEAGLLLDLVDDDKAHSAQNRGATKIGTRYVSWKIDRTKALQSLDAIGVPVAWRDELLDVWDVEREAQTLHLSMADLKAGHKKGTIGIPTIRERLLGMGHDAVDTDFLIATYFS